MIGAIIGDIVDSPYEFDRGKKIKDFGPLFIFDNIINYELGKVKEEFNKFVNIRR